MTAPNVSSYDSLLQELYSDERIQDLVAEASPTWKRMRKTNNFKGKNHNFSVIYGLNEGIGASISDAQAALGGTKAADFNLTRKTVLGVARIDRELLDVADEDRGSFVDAMDQETSGTERAFIARLCGGLFGNGGGAIGQIASTSTVNTEIITLSDPRDAIKFRPGMVIEADDTDGSGGGAVRAGTQTITAVDYTNGTVTGSLHWDDVITGVAASDYLFPKGKFAADAAGFEAWCPGIVTAMSFYGVDRTVAPTDLAGIRHSASGGSVEDALINAAVEGSRLQRKFKQIIMNPYRVGILIREQGARSTYIRTDSNDVKMGASSLGLVLPGDKGMLEIISDPYCQTDIAWFCDLDDWSIMGSKSGVPHIQKDPQTGYMWFPVYNDNLIEMRLAAYYNMKCRNPGNVLRCAF